MSDHLPAEMWFGTVRGQWPIRCWADEVHALAWVRENASEDRTIWKASVVDPVPYRVVEPKPYLTRVDKS